MIKNSMIRKLVELPKAEWERLATKYTFHKGRFSAVTFIKYGITFSTLINALSGGQKKKLMLLLFKDFFKLDSESSLTLANSVREENAKLANFLDWFSVSTEEVETEEVITDEEIA